MKIKQFFYESSILIFISVIIDFVLAKFLKYPIFSFGHWSSQILLFSFLFALGIAIFRNFPKYVYFIFQITISLLIPMLFSYSQLFFIGMNFWQTAIFSFLIINSIGLFFFYFWIRLDPEYMKILSFTLISALFYSFIFRILIKNFTEFHFTNLQFYPLFIKSITIFLISSFSLKIGEMAIYYLIDKKQLNDVLEDD